MSAALLPEWSWSSSLCSARPIMSASTIKTESRRHKMEIPLQAQVECTDGVCGRSEYVLINPVAERATHLVVREASLPHTQYIVPIELVSAEIEGTIQL